MLNVLWLLFFVLAYLAAMYQWLVFGNVNVFSDIVEATFDKAKLGVTIAIGLIGLMCFWLGIMKIAERTGAVAFIARLISPLFHRLMPGVPRDHPAFGSITMNMVANFLGLGNAATPLGLKAMKDLQDVNDDKEAASNAQILFLVLNTSSVTLIPSTIIFLRSQAGAQDPTAVFLPILLATSISSLVGLLVVAAVQRINIFHPVVLAYLGGFAAFLIGLITYLSTLDSQGLSEVSKLVGNLVIFSFIVAFLLLGAIRRVPVWEVFIEGAKEGFDVAIRIIPFLVGMLAGIAAFRASGLFDVMLNGVRSVVEFAGFNSDFVPALPVALIRPFSGSGGQAAMLELFNNADYGVNSFPSTVASVMQGSTETTFYILAVYFGSVGIRRMRHAVGCGLAADFAGMVSAILVSYWFFA